MIENIELWILGLTLAIQTVWDLRFRQIPILVTLMAGILGAVVRLFTGEVLWVLLVGILPGVLCLVLGKLTREAIGYGDGFLICAMGLCLPAEQVLGTCLLGMFFAGVVGIFQMIFCGKGSGEDLPFVPFLFFAYVFHIVVRFGMR